MDLIITILPAVTEDLPISPQFTPYELSSRCKFSNLTTRQLMTEFYLLTFPRFPLRKKEHKSCFDKNRTHGFRTSKCAGYLLDHSGSVVSLCPSPEKKRIGRTSPSNVYIFPKTTEGKDKRSLDYRYFRSQRQREKSPPGTDDFFERHLVLKGVDQNRTDSSEGGEYLSLLRRTIQQP